MELINNRYRIIKNLKQNRLFSNFLVSDITDEYREIQLNLFHSDFLPGSLLETYANNFIEYTNIVNDNIVKDYKFGIVSHIDNKKANDNQFYFTTEYFEKSTNIFELTKDMNINNLLEVFIEVCRALSYVHLKGHIYGELNTGNILIIKKENGYKFKLKDLASIELEKHVYNPEKVDETYYKAPRILTGEKANRETDMYSLGVLLLDLICRNKREAGSVKAELELLKEDAKLYVGYSYGTEELEIINKLVPLMEKLLSTMGQYPYLYLYDFIEELNNCLDRDYKVINIKELDQLTFKNKIVGRQEEVNNVLKSYDYMIKYKPVKRIFLVHGSTGCGKTRLLKEIEFQLGLKRANVYASYSLSALKDSSNQLWIEILRKLISDSDSETIEKYESELMKFFPEIADRKAALPVEYLSRDKAKYRLINRIVGFISENVKNRPTVVIVDNIHLANEFTIDTMKYLASEIANHGNIIMIFSYNDSEVLKNPKFSEFVANFRERKDSDVVNVRDFDYVQTGELVRSILSMPYTPIKLVEKIYSHSYGNPMFICEILKHLYSRKILYVNPNNGRWFSDYATGNGYNDFPMPNSIEQAVINQLRDSDEKAHEILNVASIFTNAISTADMMKFINIDANELENNVQELVAKGLLCKKIGDTCYVYEINSKVLKDIVYDRLSAEDRVEKHKIAASILEMESETVLRNNFEELIMHFERAGIKEKVKKYCIENAKQMELLKDRNEQIKSLEKAISMIDNKDSIEKGQLLIQIGMLYNDASNLDKALEYYIKAEKIAKRVKDSKLLFDVTRSILYTNMNQNNMQKVRKGYLKLQTLIKDIDDKESLLELNSIGGYLTLVNGDIQKSAEMFSTLIDECGDGHYKIKGDACRLLAYSYSLDNRVEEALIYNKKSITYLEMAGKMKGVIMAYNNIGAIYMDYYQDYDMSLEYINKVKDLSEEYNFPTTGLLAMTNSAAMHESKFERRVAYDNYKEALGMALKANVENDIFFLYNALTAVCLRLSYYSEACEYFELAKDELEKHPEQGKDIVVYYKNMANFNFAFGEFNEAEKYIKTAYKKYGKEESVDKLDCEMTQYIIEMKHKPISVYTDSISKLINKCHEFVMPGIRVLYLSIAAYTLALRKDLKNARMLIREAEKSLIGFIPDEVQATYLYAVGISGNSEVELKQLSTAIEIAKKINYKDLIYKITTAIGDYYFEAGKQEFAAFYYIEAFEISKSLIAQVPNEMKLLYVNNHNMAKAYNRARCIKERLMGGNEQLYCNLAVESGLKSYEDIDRLFEEDLVTDFSTNIEFIRAIRKMFMSYLPIGITDEVDILASLGTDVIKNIELVLRYLATLTFASNASVVVEDNHSEQKVIASINGNNSMINKYVFDRIKASAEPILITENHKSESEAGYLTDELKACICIPIKSGNILHENAENAKARYTTSNASVWGYLYLESDKILNNFNSNGLNSCLEFIGLLAILLEKHQLKLSASIDKLTGALTRKYLEDALEEVLEKSSAFGTGFSIIIYDLDKFKSVNDRFGHQTGDEVLKKVSKLVLDNIGRNDILGRYGGEEFIIILPDTGVEDAESVAEELRKKIHKEKILGDKADITVSMGIAYYPMHGQSVQEIVEKADQALYVAKENGRNRCQVWDSGFTSKVKGTNKLNGIITGNAVQDSRNVLALVELIQLVNSKLSKKEKIYSFLGRIIEIAEAQFGALLLLNNEEVVQQYSRKALEEDWGGNIDYNRNAVASVIKNRQGVYMIDWDYVGNHDVITGIPDWYSILVVPVLVSGNINGVIYLSVSTKVKEYGFDDFNFVNVLSDLAASIL